MSVYSSLSKISFLKNKYVAKFMFVAILGINIPVALFFIVIYYGKSYLAPLDLIAIILVLTIVGSFLTIRIIKSLMSPFNLGSKALLEYVNNQTNPQLPNNFTDDAGVMLKNIQSLIIANQKLVLEKREICDLLTLDLRDKTVATEKLIHAISQSSSDATVKKLTQNAADAVKQQIDFVDKYVEILKQEDFINKQPIKVRKINVHDLLDDVKAKFKSVLAAKNIEIKYNLKISRLRLKVSGTLLEIALGYLLDFAIKSAPENSKIDIISDRNRGKLLIQIRDYGVTLDSTELPKIFNKYYVLPENVNDELQSVGNSLYFCNQIIERFGGTLTAESGGKSGGTIFSVDLKMYR